VQPPIAWRCPEPSDPLTTDHHTGHSLRILADRDLEENGPSPLFHG
jgi:hypothetical protein